MRLRCLLFLQFYGDCVKSGMRYARIVDNCRFLIAVQTFDLPLSRYRQRGLGKVIAQAFYFYAKLFGILLNLQIGLRAREFNSEVRPAAVIANFAFGAEVAKHLQYSFADTAVMIFKAGYKTLEIPAVKHKRKRFLLEKGHDIRALTVKAEIFAVQRGRQNHIPEAHGRRKAF